MASLASRAENYGRGTVEIDAEFVKAYRTLRARIEAFLALPLGTLQRDLPALKAAMDGIAAVTGPRGV